MDESHRYRASAGVRAINELKPVLAWSSTWPGAIQDVVLGYPLGRAIADGFVKEPAVVTRKDFNPAGMSTDEIERMKLEDGVRLQESVKVQLDAYAREYSRDIVKPFVLVIPSISQSKCVSRLALIGEVEVSVRMIAVMNRRSMTSDRRLQ
jgi:type III restriction enzyme